MFEEFSKCALVAKMQQEGKKVTSSSYYLDSNGRACLSVPLELSFPTEKLLTDSLDANCFHPKPLYKKNDDADKKSDTGETQSSNIFIEAKVVLTFGSGEAILALVEQVRVHSITVQSPTSLLFETDVFIRVSHVDENARGRMTDVKVAIEMSAVLHQRLPVEGDDSTNAALQLLKTAMNKSIGADAQNIRSIRTNSASIKAHLTQALTVHVDSVSGPAAGETFLSVHIRHSCTHKEPVTITRIRLHPLQEETTLAVPQSTSSTVRWAFAEHCDPGLPITLNPEESFFTILLVDASRDSICRTFKCPVSVTAVLGKRENSEDYRYQVAASAQAEFTSSPMASEPSDGFFLDFQLIGDKARVGSLIVVRVDVRNLSNETRDNLLLLVGNNDADREEELALAPNESPRRLEVSTELDDGYRIGVRGLSLTEVMNSSHETLIPLDTGYLLPQMEGHKAITVDLRFIPRKEGLAIFPHLQIVDRTKGITYVGFHKFRAAIGA